MACLIMTKRGLLKSLRFLVSPVNILSELDYVNIYVQICYYCSQIPEELDLSPLLPTLLCMENQLY